ncbi:hypothetical protein [Streptomyces sp. NPDC046759]|uniref:hypothetical protein n=1 Tax=Streptomyces sp. NPDC046759 TaxID=3155019 RepID=UPI0033FCE030
MSPIRAQSRTRDAGDTEDTAQAPARRPAQRGEPDGGAFGVRRGRHRKPRPRKVLLAAGGLALAAGVLSLVRVAPESGAGSPGTAEAEPRLGAGGGATDHAANTAATLAAGPTALPSATSVMGGSSPAPSGTAAARATTGPAAPTTSAGGTAVPAATTVPTGPAAPPRPSATVSAPRPDPTASAPASTTPAPGHSTAAPGPGGLCVPVLGLCVDLRGGTGH